MLLLLLATSAVMAQSAPNMNAQLMRPSVDGAHTLWTDDATFARRLLPQARLLFQYVNDPLVFQPADASADPSHVLSDLVQGDALLSLAYDRVSFGVDVPAELLVKGTGGTGGGLGDVNGALRVGLVDPQRNPLGLAMEGRLMLPTSTASNALSAPALGYEVGGILDLRLDDTTVLANFGTRGSPKVVLDNVTLHDQVYGRVAVSQALAPQDGGGLALELAGHANYSAPLDNTVSVPIEGMITGWLRTGGLVLRAGGGLGFTDGIGAPDARALVGLGLEPRNVADRDHDGVPDDRDRCPGQAEDVDGYQDADGCLDPETPVRVYFVDEDGQPIPVVRMAVDAGDGFHELAPNQDVRLHPGTLELQATADGFMPLDTTIDVPQADHHEVTKVMVRPAGTIEVRVVDARGSRVDARIELDGGDRGRVLATAPRVKVRAGEHTIRASANGFRPTEVHIDLKANTTEVVELVMEPARVVVTTEKIELREKVFFDFNKTTIKPESFPLLDEIVGVLQDHPEIRKVRIEGHTDEQGSDEYNQTLSEGRAASVRSYLEQHGIAQERLSSVGFGESRPLVDGHDETAWSQNRRVELWIEERAP